MESDAKLIERVLAGDKDSFRPLVQRYQDAVFGVAVGRTGNFADAEEIAQDAFLAAYRKLSQLKDHDSFGAWVCGIARNRVRMHLRNQRIVAKAQQRLGELARRNGQTRRPDEAQELVRSALDRLSPVGGEVATLYYINGYSVAQVSRFVGRPEGTVKSRLHEARNQLRKELLIMMKHSLKSSRPGKEFTKAVVRRITQSRVWISGGNKNYLLLRDDKGNSEEFFLGAREAQEIRLCLKGTTPAARTAPPPGTSIYAALISAMSKLDYRILEVVIRGSPNPPNAYVQLRVRRGREKEKIVEAEYSQRDAIQLAVHTRAPLLLEGKNVVKDKQGRPLKSGAAWRQITSRQEHPFRSIPEVICELEANPDSDRARRAIHEAPGIIQIEDALVADATGGWETVLQWYDRCRGTDHEALANAILGALYIRPMGTPKKAIPHLERAHKLQPDDDSIAFDLATAYAMTGCNEEALQLVQRFRFKEAIRCHNFEPLWKDPRFTQAVGKPQAPKDGQFMIVKQTRLQNFSPRGLIGARGLQRSFPPVRCPSASGSLKREIQSLLGPQTLVDVVKLVCWLGKSRYYILMELTDAGVACVEGPEGFDRRNCDLSQAFSGKAVPWKAPTEGTAQIMEGCGINALAVVVSGRKGQDVLAELIFEQAGHRDHVTIDGLDALTLAIRQKLPLFLSDTAMGELVLRGKTGRQLTLAGVVRQLSAREKAIQKQ
jgi:RNA polymerase sigma-70 factor (ECF subfamily)